MRKLAIVIVVLAGVALGGYFLFFKSSPPPEPRKEQKNTPPVKPAPKKPSPVFEPSKFHQQHHYTGPKNRYAENYFKNENVREEVSEDREELADTLQKYDRDNHYDHHDDYQYAFDNYYYDDDYYYHDYYDYMYPQFDEREWEHLNSIYSDPDVKDYLKEEHKAHKAEKENPSEVGSVKNNAWKQNLPAQKVKAAEAKLSDPVVKKEQKLREQFRNANAAELRKIAQNPVRTLDLFQARKDPHTKFDIFGTHADESLSVALTEPLKKKILSRDILITDGSSSEIEGIFADSGKAEIKFDYEKDDLESEVKQHMMQKVVVVVKATTLFGEKGLLSHLVKDGYTIQRYRIDSQLEKYEIQE